MISDEQAKAIARLWATEDPRMMTFLRSGAIDSELIELLVTDVRLLGIAVVEESSPPVVAYAQLRALVHYMAVNGPRAALPGWREIGHAAPPLNLDAWTNDARVTGFDPPPRPLHGGPDHRSIP